MTHLELAYERCEAIARSSGSSFYRSFSLLRRDRRRAMLALYAFARLADDAIDGPNAQRGTWDAEIWHRWIDYVCREGPTLKIDGTTPASLLAIGPAMMDLVQRFAIPADALHAIVHGVDFDAHGPRAIATWEQLQKYCHLVASSVGIACLAIWRADDSCRPSHGVFQAAIDCGIAFQLTNILRDIAEDARSGRIYLPREELDRFGVTPESLVYIGESRGDWRGLLRVQFERAHAHYDRGWCVINVLPPDAQRMFSLMWHSYRSILLGLEREPERIGNGRWQLASRTKWKLACQHIFTPWFLELKRQQNARIEKQTVEKGASHGIQDPLQRPDWTALPKSTRVAIVGGGLAGIATAMHLARHGLKVSLYESKSRLGGRVGSFFDEVAKQSVDYCQHVGMVCCKAFQQWLRDTHQEPEWTEVDTLHFVSARGQKIRVRALPLVAPAHMLGLLFHWPDLSWTDRWRVGIALLRLYRMKPNPEWDKISALQWLKHQKQSEQSIRSFWSTILVSALGEQVDRVTMGAVRKVLIDGFAADRRAFHLLVPKKPLATLLDDYVQKQLHTLNVGVYCNQPVQALKKTQDGWNIDGKLFDMVVVAVPWNRIGSLLERTAADETGSLNEPSRLAMTEVARITGSMQSSPVTGIHTWWDRPWLREPHAILIDRLCQWVFPSPDTTSSTLDGLHYYQIVISGSRSLPSGDPERILRAIKKDLAEVLPESAVASLLRGRVVTDPHSVFSVDVDHAAARYPSDCLSQEGIFLAGDWIKTGWPATMEGALRSGAIAAQHVLSVAGRAAHLLPEDD